jgi:hypothetical protein
VSARNGKLAGVAKIDARTVPSEVGVCLNDLNFAASMVARAFGCTKPESAVDIIKAAVSQASIEIRLVAETMEDGSDEHFALLGVVDRLEGAAETAEILFKLYQLPSFSDPTPSVEVQP